MKLKIKYMKLKKWKENIKQEDLKYKTKLHKLQDIISNF